MFANRFYRSKTFVGAAIAAALLPLAWAGFHRHPDASSALLRVTFLDVGQGDAAVIETPGGHTVVIDGGGHPDTDERWGDDPGTRVVVPFLRSRSITNVDLIVPTHPDDDHVQGLNAVVERLRVAAALDCGYPGPSDPYTRLIAKLHRRSIPVFVARRGQVFDFGDGARFEVLNPPDHAIAGAHSQTNNNSVTVRLVYGRSRFLFTGDAEAEAEGEMLRHCADLSADVLKVGHHGSRWSSNDAFLDAVHPSVAVISCGKNNVYNHPHKEVLDRLKDRGVTVFRTDRQGAIMVTSDGNRIRVNAQVAPD